MGGRFDGRSVVVTGGASGVGQATVRRLLDEGARVASLDVEPVGVPSGAMALTCDVSQEPEVHVAIDEAASEFGGLHGLVTCAAVFLPGDLKPTAEVDLGDFVRTLEVDLIGTWLACKHALPHLVAAGGGSVVAVASTAALRGHGRGSGYTAAKGGVTALVRLLAVQYGRHGVRANVICPGGIDTPMTQGAYRRPESIEFAQRHIPLQRFAEADDIAATILFLLSDDSAYLTGTTIVADGGLTVS